MPVFVEWRWKEETKTFLVIFHFYDDFSRTNLRVNTNPESNRLTLFKYVGGDDFLEDTETKGPWLTWSPSHMDLALLTDLLTYANIINGFKEAKKRSLIQDLEFVSRKGTINKLSGEIEKGDWFCIGKINYAVGEDKKHASYYVNHHGFAMVELCPEYIAYVKELARV